MRTSPMQHDFRQPSGLRKKYLDSSNIRIIRQPRIAPIEFLNLDTVINSYVSGPEIQWNPSYAAFQSRVEMLSKLQFPRPQSVPSGFPETVNAPWVWVGSDFQTDEDYVFQLEKKDTEEIEVALRYFKSKPSRL
jgi:hypothetical protein